MLSLVNVLFLFNIDRSLWIIAIYLLDMIIKMTCLDRQDMDHQERLGGRSGYSDGCKPKHIVHKLYGVGLF